MSGDAKLEIAIAVVGAIVLAISPVFNASNGWVIDGKQRTIRADRTTMPTRQPTSSTRSSAASRRPGTPSG